MKIVYIDMDDVLCDYTGAHKTAKEANPEIEYPQSVPGFWLDLPPLPGAIETVKELQAKFDVYILSAPSIHNPISYSEKRLWVEKYFGYDFCDRLIISSHKGLNKGHYLIDDYVDGRGQEDFEGELLHFGSAKFPNWITILEYLK
jgi:5'(3')-deoxyribonucleotidase